MAMDFLFLNLQTILLYALTMMTEFLQTAKNNSHQLQEMQTTCKAQTPPIIRSQKESPMTSSGISNFQKIGQNVWYQSYNSGIYYTTPWCSKFEWFSWKFRSRKFNRTCIRCDGFVWTTGVRYVAENALFVFTPGFLSIILWWREQRTWGALPSRHFGDATQVQGEMERCHVRWLLLDDENRCFWNKILSTGQKTRHYCQ